MFEHQWGGKTLACLASLLEGSLGYFLALVAPQMTTIDGTWIIFVSVYGFVDYRPTLNSTLCHIPLEWAYDEILTETWTICHRAMLPKSIISSERRIPTKNNLLNRSVISLNDSTCPQVANTTHQMDYRDTINSRLSFMSLHAAFFIRITCFDQISKSLWEIQI